MSISLTGHNKRPHIQICNKQPAKKKQRKDSPSTCCVKRLSRDTFCALSRLLNEESFINLSKTCKSLMYLRKYVQVYDWPFLFNSSTSPHTTTWVDKLDLTNPPEKTLSEFDRIKLTIHGAVSKTNFKKAKFDKNQSLSFLKIFLLRQKHLYHLEIRNHEGFDQELFLIINKISSLRHLAIPHCNITDKQLSSLSNLHLNSLDISENPEISDRGLASITPNFLSELNLSGCRRITDAAILRFKGRLNKLNITECVNLTRAIFQSVNPSLTYLDVSQNQDIISEALSLQRFPSLKELIAEDLILNDDFGLMEKIIASIKKNNKKLDFLNLYQGHMNGGLQSDEILQLGEITKSALFTLWSYSGATPLDNDEHRVISLNETQLQNMISDIKKLKKIKEYILKESFSYISPYDVIVRCPEIGDFESM